MTKYFLLFLIAAQSLCFSENIKFYIFDSRHGNELKPDSVILENVTTKKRIYLLTDTLILTEVGSSPQAFINTSPDFKAKANIINNNIDLEIDNNGAENIAIELYGYLGNTLFNEETPINIGVTRKNISLENINDKLLFLRIKSAKSIQTGKLNRTISDFAYEATPIFKPGDEILNGDIIDTAYKYNLYIYKKGYRDYKDLNISFTGKKYYVANLVEKTIYEKIYRSGVTIKGLKIIRKNESSSGMPQQPPSYSCTYDTISFSYLNGSINLLGHPWGRCGDCRTDLFYDYIFVCYSNSPASNGSTSSYHAEAKANLDLSTGKLDKQSYAYCHFDYGWYGNHDNEENMSISIDYPKAYDYYNKTYYFKIYKDEIIKLINSHKLNLSVSTRIESRTNGGYTMLKQVSNLVRILEVADDAFIELYYFEE